MKRSLTITLLAVPALLLSGLAKETPKAGNRPSDKVIAAWEAAGAELHWMRLGQFGYWEEVDVDRATGKGDLPTFQFETSRHVELRELPVPQVPFGVSMPLEGPFLESNIQALSGYGNLRLCGAHLANVKESSDFYKYLGRLANIPGIDTFLCLNNERDFAMLDRFQMSRSLQIEGGTEDWQSRAMAKLANFASLESLTLNSITYDSGMDVLQHIPHLKYLQLWGCEWPSDSIKFVSRCPNLQGLYIRSFGEKWDDTTLSYLKDLSKLEALLVDLHRPTTDKGVQQLAQLSNLHCLKLLSVNLGEAGFKSISQMQNLEELLLYCDQVKAADAAHLARLPNLRSLTLLCDVGVDDNLLAKWAENTSLRTLQIYCGGVTASGLEAISRMKNLETLSLYKLNIANEDLRRLGSLPNLRTLYLQDRMYRLSEEGLAELSRFPKLRSLTIEGSSFGNLALKEIAKLKELSQLSLFDTKVSAAGLKELAALPRLQSLTLSKVPMLDEDVESFAALTNLRQLWLPEEDFSPKGAVLLMESLAKLPHLHWIDDAPFSEADADKSLPHTRVMQRKQE